MKSRTRSTRIRYFDACVIVISSSPALCDIKRWAALRHPGVLASLDSSVLRSLLRLLPIDILYFSKELTASLDHDAIYINT